jgi:hypothetical protein
VVSDRPARVRRRRATDPPLEAEPTEAIAQMEEATQRLRDQAWMINAATRPPMVADPRSAEQDADVQEPS